jgi:SagB-type dehydrogenase family enzyme
MIRWPATELDPTSIPAMRDTILQFDAAAPHDHAPRSYPGYPRTPLPRATRRSSLDDALAGRRSPRALGRELPGADELGRIMGLAHGVCADGGRGPVPSAGGLQAIELYVGVLAPGWLAAGMYHYDRADHALAKIADGFDPMHVPSLITVEGGALVWVIAGDGARVAAKYGPRGMRFLLLEAGHLMQNLCLACVDAGFATVPFGGFCERLLARALSLPPTDEVLYAGLCGRA